MWFCVKLNKSTTRTFVFSEKEKKDISITLTPHLGCGTWFLKVEVLNEPVPSEAQCYRDTAHLTSRSSGLHKSLKSWNALS